MSGTVIGDINLFTGAPVRTRYREQVLRIAPPDLVGRDVELAQVAEFCTAPEPDRSYWWWRGDAWAGKSALMSWFVLNPPPGIRVVSFIITARLAGQDDRIAFTENVLEQLATLLDEPMPAFLTGATRDAHLLGMLSDAAHACRARNERLVFVVDGLDEDRGVTTGPDAYSIAALLPDPPPADMRIIVAGRPNPPIPADVPVHHQLRDPAIVHRLTVSSYAAVVRNDMERELKRLLRGSQAGQDLLGVLTAARGGLSGSDLAELAARPAWQVDEELRTVTGRSFSMRPSQWAPDIRPDVYVLGHEELMDTAKKYLGIASLGIYQQRLHDWADQYRQRAWPADTPEYLLQGYYSMLKETGDLERMIACATDRHRHNRMLDITGGETASLAEITSAQDAILDDPKPDLLTMARLAIHRESLTGRNNIPVQLPAVWVALGRLTRAETLARAIPRPYRQAEALAGLAQAIADVDLARAEALARSIADRDQQADALASLAMRIVQVDLDRAEKLARSITDGDRRASALADLVGAVAATDPGRAEALALSITNPSQQAAALADLLKGLAGTDPDRARVLARRVAISARPIAHPGGDLLAALSRVAQIVTSVYPRQAPNLLDQVGTLVRTITDPEPQAYMLSRLAEALEAVNPNHAETPDRPITNLEWEVGALAIAAEALACVDPARARALADRAEALAGTISDRRREQFRAAGFGIGDELAMFLLVEAIEDGDRDRLRAQFGRSQALLRAVTESQDPACSRLDTAPGGIYSPLLGRLEMLVRSITDPQVRDEALAELTNIMAAAAEVTAAAEPAQARTVLDRLEMLVRSVTDPNHQGEALANLAAIAARVARATSGAGSAPAVVLLDRAEALMNEAKALAPPGGGLADLVESLDEPEETLMQLPLAAARIAPDRAESLFRAIVTRPRPQALLMPEVVLAMAGTDPGQACALADHAEQLLLTISYHDLDLDAVAELIRYQADGLATLAKAVADIDPVKAGTLANRAEAVARTDPDYESEIGRLAVLALEEARVDPGHARLLLDRIEPLIRARLSLKDVSPSYPRAMRELMEAAVAVVAADPAVLDLLFDHAISVTESAIDPDRHILGILAERIAAVDPDLARGMYDSAGALARASPEWERRPFFLGLLAETVTHVDPERARTLFGDAETMACSITDPGRQARTLAELAEMAANLDREWARAMFDRADTLAGSIIDPSKKAAALAELAEKAVSADPDRTPALFDQVESQLDAITGSIDGLVRSTVRLHLNQAMARLDPARATVLLDQAERLTQMISTASLWPPEQADALAYLAEAVAGAAPDRAETLARSIDDPERQAQVLANLAKLAARDNPDRAKALAQSISDPDQRAQALTYVEDADLARKAKAAKPVDLDRAEALAQAITNPDWKALALADLARKATPEHARRLIAQAFRLSDWPTPLHVLAEIQPATLTAIADDLLQLPDEPMDERQSSSP